jgi:hypothetical protein
MKPGHRTNPLEGTRAAQKPKWQKTKHPTQHTIDMSNPFTSGPTERLTADHLTADRLTT